MGVDIDRQINQAHIHLQITAVIQSLGRTLDLKIDDAGSREVNSGKMAVATMAVVCANSAVLAKWYAEGIHHQCQRQLA